MMQNSIDEQKPLGAGAKTGRFLLRFQSAFGLVAILIAATIFSPIRADGGIIFLDPSNLLNIARFASENGIIAVGLTLVILTAGIDLSVGSLLALCAVGAAALMTRHNLGVFSTVLAMLLLGTGAGAINGLVTTQLGIQSFITTLAMLTAARGVATLWSQGQGIPLAFGEGGNAPPLFKSLFAGELNLLGFEIPVPILYFIAVGALVSFVLRRTGFGRHVYAVGSNEVAARLSGVNVHRVKIIVFAASGLLSGLAALLHAGLTNEGNPTAGQGYELNAIAAVVIGGTSLAGGAGTIIGSMIGALILGVLDNILGLRNIQAEYQNILKGILIVLAVVLQRKRK